MLKVPKQWNKPNILGNMNTGGYRGVAAFSPADVANLFQWYDASDLATITKDGSDRVSQWDDKSSTGLDLTQATAGNQPLWLSADQNGKDVISFDSSVRGLFNSTISKAAPFTIFMACKHPPDGNGTVIVQVTGTTGGVERIDKQTTNGLFDLVGSLTLNNGTTSKVNTWQNNFYIMNGASSEIDIGGDTATGTMGASGTWTNFKVNFYSAGEFGGVWKIGELIIYDAVISGTDKTDIQTYLKNKWNTPT